MLPQHELGWALTRQPSLRPPVRWLWGPGDNARELSASWGGPLVRSDAPPGGMCFPALGVLDYRVLGTNFRDHAIVFTQLEFKDEAFSTVEL